jgi:hypothetical protein
VNVVTLEEMPEFDFKTPFDELIELRKVLTAQQIADLTGLRRETISRARPDSRFQRRTEKALRDLYLVVTRMRSVNGDDVGQLAAVLRRPQPELAGRSIAELLQDGQVDVVLERLSSVRATEGESIGPTEEEALASWQLDPEVAARLTPWKEPSKEEIARDPALDDRIAALLAADPKLASRLDAIEAALLAHFGDGAKVERQIISDYDDPDGEDELYLRVHADLSFDDEIDRLAEFLRRQDRLLAPVRRQLVIGFLG